MASRKMDHLVSTPSDKVKISLTINNARKIGKMRIPRRTKSSQTLRRDLLLTRRYSTGDLRLQTGIKDIINIMEKLDDQIDEQCKYENEDEQCKCEDERCKCEDERCKCELSSGKYRKKRCKNVVCSNLYHIS